MAQGSTTSGRGFLLGAFGLVAVLAAVGVYQVSRVFLGSRPPTGTNQPRPELLCHLLYSPSTSFPGAVSWGALVQMGEALPSPKGFEIRYTATRGLAYLGQAELPLDNLAEMLDERRQMRNFTIQADNGRMVPNEGEAWGVVLIALKAVAEWHQHPEALKAVGSDHPDLKKVYRAIDRLNESSNRTIRDEAQKVRLVLNQKKPNG